MLLSERVQVARDELPVGLAVQPFTNQLRRRGERKVHCLAAQLADRAIPLGGDLPPRTRQQLIRFAKRWEPWRSVATWYMWRSLDPVPVEY